MAAILPVVTLMQCTGNASSMGGNGAPSKYPGVMMPFKKPYNLIPWAGGGGCVTTGPFKE
jgi:tyrosinase